MQELMQVEKPKAVVLPEASWLGEAHDRAKGQIAKIDCGMFSFIIKGKDKFNREASMKVYTDLNAETKDNEILSGITKGISQINDKTERIFVKKSFLNKVRPYARSRAVKQ